jgi:hypothetical protein
MTLDGWDREGNDKAIDTDEYPPIWGEIPTEPKQEMEPIPLVNALYTGTLLNTSKR